MDFFFQLLFDFALQICSFHEQYIQAVLCQKRAEQKSKADACSGCSIFGPVGCTQGGGGLISASGSCHSKSQFGKPTNSSLLSSSKNKCNGQLLRFSTQLTPFLPIFKQSHSILVLSDLWLRSAFPCNCK